MDKKESLRTLTNSYARVGFCWGVHDCCQFVSQHIANVLGIKNPAFAYHYQTEGGAQLYLDLNSGVEGICSRAVGKPPVEKDDLQLGDVCLVDLPITGEALGIRSSTGAIVVSEKGLIAIPFFRILKGWTL